MKPSKKEITNILIVGGKGEIGRTFVKAFRSISLKVFVVDKHNQDKLEGLIKKVEVVIISVPINKTLAVVEKVAPLLSQDQLLMDFTSIKNDLIEKMEKLTSAEIISLHPMFGPLSKIDKQNLIVMRVRSKFFYAKIKRIFSQLKLKVIELDHREHDKRMAVIQSLIHIMAFSLVGAIKELGFSFANLKELSTPLYRLHIDMASRLLNQSAELYTDISFQNPYFKTTGDIFVKQINSLLSLVNHQEREKFIEQFKDNASFFDDKKKSFLRSEKVMEFLATIEK